jgi:hypothetical protein
MIRAQTETEASEKDIGVREDIEFPLAGIIVWLMLLVAAIMADAFTPRSCIQAKKLDLPYVTIDDPQFISASQATFMSSSDMLIGVTDGNIAKAYPAAILAQHGVVQDRMADGPIAVTW